MSQKKKSDNKTITKHYRQGSVLQDLRNGLQYRESDYGQCPIHSFCSGTAQATHTSVPPFRLVVEEGWRGGQRPFSLITENQSEMVMYNTGLGEMRVKTRILSRLLENQTCSFLLEILVEKVISKFKLPRTTVDMKLLQIQSHSKDTDSNPDTFKAGCSV